MLQLIFLQKILVHCAHCNSFMSRQSPTNHDSLKAGNLILQRNLHCHNWLMSSYLYNPITFLFVVPGRAVSHLCYQVLPYLIISILMLEFHCVILFIKLWLYSELLNMEPYILSDFHKHFNCNWFTVRPECVLLLHSPFL